MPICRAASASCLLNADTRQFTRLICPAKNTTKDRAISQLSLEEKRVVVSKDTDFFYSHLLEGRPWKLLLIKTGNISTRDLLSLFENNLPAIEGALAEHTLVEIDRLQVTPLR